MVLPISVQDKHIREAKAAQLAGRLSCMEAQKTLFIKKGRRKDLRTTSRCDNLASQHTEVQKKL